MDRDDHLEVTRLELCIKSIKYAYWEAEWSSFGKKSDL